MSPPAFLPRSANPSSWRNGTGSGGGIGFEAGARAAPDGYTLLVASVPHVVNAALHRSLPYDPIGDFEAVSLLGSNPNLLVVHPSVPAQSIAELVALVRANPGKYSYASNSIGGSSHLGMEMFRRAAGGLDITHVPYRGSAPAMADLLSGTVHMTIDNIFFQAPFVRDGRLRALAQSGRTRNAMFPDLPTIAESGFPGFENVSWYLILAPKGTLRPVVDRLSAVIAKRDRDGELLLLGHGVDAPLRGLRLGRRAGRLERHHFDRACRRPWRPPRRTSRRR
jgi:tripartite-type tricarboxylate transporter receptor subunit TctC